MKKIKLLLLTVVGIFSFAGINMTYGFSGIKPAESVSMAALKYVQASEFVKLSAKDYEALTGKKLNFLQRLSFKATKMKMKHDLKKNPDLKIFDYVNGEGTTFRIDALWLIIGILIGPIGVLVAYATRQEKHKITSSWIGFAVWLLLGGIFFVF